MFARSLVCGRPKRAAPRGRGVLEREIRPAVQYPAKALKSDMAATPIPIADTLAEAIAVQVERWPGAWVLTDGPRS